MLSDRVKETPEVDDVGTVQVELLDGGTSDGGQADEQRKRFSPDEMLLPAVRPRVIERGPLPACRVKRLRARVFAVVTTLARKRQVG